MIEGRREQLPLPPIFIRAELSPQKASFRPRPHDVFRFELRSVPGRLLCSLMHVVIGNGREPWKLKPIDDFAKGFILMGGSMFRDVSW